MAEKLRSLTAPVVALLAAVAFLLCTGVTQSAQPAQAATTSSSRSWSTPLKLAETAQNPAIAVSAAGEFVAMWTNQGSLYSSHSRDGHTWSTPATVFTSAFYGPFGVKLSVNSSGRFIAAWFDDTSLTPLDLYTASSLDGQSWSSPTLLSAIADPSSNMLLVTNSLSSGVDLVTLARTSTPGQTQIVSFHSSNGLSWPSTPETIGSASNLELIDLCGAMTSTGEVSIAWTIWDRAAPTAEMHSANRSTAGMWSVSTVLSVQGNPRGLAINHSGLRVLVWAENSSAWQIRAMTSSDGITWGAPGLVATGYPQFSQLAVGASGRFVFSWAVYPTFDNDLFASETRNGTSWSAPTTIAGPTEATSYSSLASDGVDAFSLTFDRGSSNGLSVKNSELNSGSTWKNPVVFSAASVGSSGRMATAGLPTNKFVVLYTFSVGISPSNLYVVTNIPPTLANTGNSPFPGLAAAVIALLAGCVLIRSRRSTTL